MQPSPTRRSFLAAGFSGAILLSGAKAATLISPENRKAEPACILSGEQTEGPYYVDRKLLRRDITEGNLGLPLRLRLTVLDAARCAPMRNAAIDLWRCDATGVYSGYTKQSAMEGPGGPGGPGGRHPFGRMGGPPPFGPGGPPPDGDFPMPGPGLMQLGDRSDRRGPGGPPPHHGPSDDKTFFRGVQVTNDEGIAEFATVYPGWYMGRCVHIHLKVWTNGSVADGKYTGGHTCHTGQLFFPEDMTGQVARVAPYSSHHIERTQQQEDMVYTSQAGPDCIVSLAQTDKRALNNGFVATAVLGINPAATPRQV